MSHTVVVQLHLSCLPGIMSIVRDVERRRADRLRLAYHAFCVGENTEQERFDPIELGREVLLDESTARSAARHLIELGILRSHDDDHRTVSLSESGMVMFQRAERRPSHKAFGFAALLERGMREGPFPTIGRMTTPEDASRELWTLFWIYSLAGGDVDCFAAKGDLVALVGVRSEVLDNILFTLEMDDLIRFDPSADTVSPAITGVVLLETIIWHGERSVAGYPSAVSLGLIEAEDLPRRRR